MTVRVKEGSGKKEFYSEKKSSGKEMQRGTVYRKKNDNDIWGKRSFLSGPFCVFILNLSTFVHCEYLSNRNTHGQPYVSCSD